MCPRNVGAATEPGQLADLAGVARSCDRWGMPLLAMAYSWGGWMPWPLRGGATATTRRTPAALGTTIVMSDDAISGYNPPGE